MKQIIVFLMVILVFSCSKRQEKIQVVETENLTQKQIDSVLDEYNFQYSKLVFIDSTEKAILPISTQRASGGSRFSKDPYYSDGYPQYWNLIFYDIKSGETKLLTRKKTRISTFKTNINYGGEILKNSVLYEIADTDFNLDYKLNYNDPEQLYISDIDGENFRILSPKDEHIVEYHIVPDTDKIVFQTLRDTNNDKEFDKKDEVIWYLIDLSTNSKALEVLNEGKRKDIENLFFKQWLVKSEKSE